MAGLTGDAAATAAAFGVPVHSVYNAEYPTGTASGNAVLPACQHAKRRHQHAGAGICSRAQERCYSAHTAGSGDAQQHSAALWG